MRKFSHVAFPLHGSALSAAALRAAQAALARHASASLFAALERPENSGVGICGIRLVDENGDATNPLLQNTQRIAHQIPDSDRTSSS